MDINLLSLFVFPIGGLIIGGCFLHRKWYPRESRFDSAEKQFLDVSINSSNPRYSFEGRTATVVRKVKDQSNGEDTSYALTIYALNERGEYFVFRSDGKSPSVKHIEHRLAKIVLKNEYLFPQEND